MSIIARMDRAFYPDAQNNWDDVLFRNQILRHLQPDWEILDIGAGAGIVTQMDFRGHVRRICGIDLDPRVTSNPMLDEGVVANAGAIPYADGRFDLVFADNVMEHLTDPAAAYREIFRVLKPGGVMLFKTPNRNHYMPFIARHTPHRFHQFFNRLRGRDAEDTFPTCYLSNARAHIRDLARGAGFAPPVVTLVESRPEYLRIHPITYLAGIVYERVVNAIGWLEGLRILIIAEMTRPREP